MDRDQLSPEDAFGAFNITITSPSTFGCLDTPVEPASHKHLLDLLLAAHANISTVYDALCMNNDYLVLLGKIEVLEQLSDVVTVEFQHTHSDDPS